MGFKILSEVPPDVLRQIRQSKIERHEGGHVQRMTKMLLSLEEIYVDKIGTQLGHALQSGTHAVRSNASDEMVLCALFHDIGKAIQDPNHAAIAAEMLKPFVSFEAYEIVRTHTYFQRYFINKAHGTEHNLRDEYAHQPWYGLALKFNDWDAMSFDIDAKPLPVEYFLPLMEKFFGKYPSKNTADKSKDYP